jgi:signal transduction histidine kinase
MAVSFLLTFLILHSIHGSVSTLNSRYQILFDESPTAVLEEDWSEAIEYVRSEYTGRPDRLRQFLLAYPEVVRQAVARVRTVRANEAALSLLEIDDPSSVPGYKGPKDVTEENLESHVGTLVALHQGVKTWDRDIPAVSRFGEPRWLQARSVDTSESTPASSIVIGLTDVTHIKARNEAMAELMRAKDQFIANVSHELRTPLTAVVGLTSELVAEQTMGQEERVELLKLVSSQASEMANIVEDLLVAARSQMGTVAVQLQEVDLVVELRSTIDGLGITLDVPERVPPQVIADPRRVRQILRNLLTNAIRYGGPHRRVVTGTLFDRVWLEVRDDGEGIPNDDAERIFEPYVTGNAGVQGSVGLGLAVARQLAELMEGSLRYSRTGGESIFRLELPAAIWESALASHHESG